MTKYAIYDTKLRLFLFFWRYILFNFKHLSYLFVTMMSFYPTTVSARPKEKPLVTLKVEKKSKVEIIEKTTKTNVSKNNNSSSDDKKVAIDSKNNLFKGEEKTIKGKTDEKVKENKSEGKTEETIKKEIEEVIKNKKGEKTEDLSEYKHKIFIDQGHNPTGSHNTGAFQNDLHEEDITYSVGKKLESLLKNNQKFEVKVSRPSADTVLGIDRDSSLNERCNMANSWGADVMISIHCNSFTSESANGTECYVYKLEDENSKKLADLILDSIVSKLGTKKRKVVSEEFRVLKNTNMTSVLVEMAFLSNKADSELLKNRQDDFAKAIYDAIVSYFS